MGMKLGLTLSVLYLLGSIGFWFFSTHAGFAPAEGEPDAALGRAREASGFRGGGPARSLAWAPPTVEPLPGAGEPEPEEADEELEPAGPEEAILRGRVGVASGELPPGTRLFLTSMTPPPPAASDSGDEEDAEPEEPQPYEDQEEVGEEGEFEFFLGPGSYRLVARAPGHLPAALELLSVVAGEELRDLFLELRPGLVISGTVRAGGEAQIGIPVVAEGQGFRATSFSDDEGHFEIAGLAPGPYQLRAFSEFAGGDDMQAFAGTEVALELARRDRLRGRVVDERGFGVGGAAVFGISFPGQAAVPDHDPYGPLDYDGFGGMSSSGCGPLPSCRELATTRASGAFELEVARGSLMSLGAMAGEAKGVLKAVRPESGEVLLVVRKLSPVRLALTDRGGSPAAGQVQLEAESLFDFASEWINVGADGLASVYPWPEVEQTLRPSRNLKLATLEALPENLRLSASRPHSHEFIEYLPR